MGHGSQWIGIMDYSKIYNDFISDRREREYLLVSSGGYYERHHIIPRSLGGSDEKSNIICLSASDHLFAHKLLALIHGGSMWHALNMCNIAESSCKGVRLCRRWYDKVRKERASHISKTMSGEGHHFYGKRLSPEHIKKLVDSHIGKRTGEENNNYDPTVHCFRNIDGRKDRLTKSEFRKKHGLSSSRVSDICNGNRPTAHGWYVSPVELDPDKLSRKGVYHGSVKSDIYKFVHESGLCEECTQYDLRVKYPGLSQSHISSLCRGDRKKHKGWRIAE